MAPRVSQTNQFDFTGVFPVENTNESLRAFCRISGNDAENKNPPQDETLKLASCVIDVSLRAPRNRVSLAFLGYAWAIIFSLWAIVLFQELLCFLYL